jgi:hypothetical protein
VFVVAIVTKKHFLNKCLFSFHEEKKKKYYFTDLRRTGGDFKISKTVLKTRLKTKKTIYFNFWKIPCCPFLKLLKKGIFSVFERFIEDYLRNLTCWEKSKNKIGLSATSMNR